MRIIFVTLLLFNFIYSFKMNYECKLSFRAERSIVWNFSFQSTV